MSPDFEVRGNLQAIAKMIKEEIPPGWALFLFVAPLDDREGLGHYVSTMSRDSAVKTMQEFIRKNPPEKFGTHQEEIA